MRVPLIAGNWKMNNTISESIEFVENLSILTKDLKSDVEILICVPFTTIYKLKQLTNSTNIKIGAQNMFYEEKGAYTGEISPIMLRDIGVDYVIIGHSERRQYFNETDDIINKKIKAALKHNLKVILCVGETLDERESGVQENKVKNQIINALAYITYDNIKNIVIAYEPIWAIGTGKTATSNQANEMCLYIRNIIKDLYNEDISENLIIQYGGSVNKDNAFEIMNKSDIDGALVGGASLKAESFIKIINYNN